MNTAEIQRHRRTGSLCAQRALKQLDVDYDSPIDVFGAIERERVWLMFQPLDRLYGAYRRHETPGVVLHSGHPTRLQRFTAAHELGHHLLGHDLSIDCQAEVERSDGTLPVEEIQAQAFAATFLMPVQLVNRALASLGLPRKPHTLSPEQAYRVSLELGSSYRATVTQLRALDRVSYTNAQELLGVRPIDIKTGLALGERPANSRADVWPLTLADSGRELWIAPDDEVHARLTEMPTTGYRWLPTPPDEAIEIAGNRPLQTDRTGRQHYGGTRERHVWWRALSVADTKVAAELRRSFERDECAAVDRFDVDVHVVPAPTGDSAQGVSRRQLQLSPA